MKHRIVPVEPTNTQILSGGISIAETNARGDRATAVSAKWAYQHMMAAAEPFEWPEEAVDAAYSFFEVFVDQQEEQGWDFTDLRNFVVEALNAALKVVEGR